MAITARSVICLHFARTRFRSRGGGSNDFLHTCILQFTAVCEVEDTKTLVCSTVRQAEEGVVSDAGTVGEAELP